MIPLIITLSEMYTVTVPSSGQCQVYNSVESLSFSMILRRSLALTLISPSGREDTAVSLQRDHERAAGH